MAAANAAAVELAKANTATDATPTTKNGRHRASTGGATSNLADRFLQCIKGNSNNGGRLSVGTAQTTPNRIPMLEISADNTDGMGGVQCVGIHVIGHRLR